MGIQAKHVEYFQKHLFYPVKSKCIIYSSQAKQAQNLQIVLVLPDQILMYFDTGKQSKQKLKIIPNKTQFSFSAYKQSKPKKIK